MRLLFILCLIWQSSQLPGGGVCCNGFSSRRQRPNHRTTTPAVRWTEKRGGDRTGSTNNAFSEDIAALYDLKRHLKNPWNIKHLGRNARSKPSDISLKSMESYKNRGSWTSLFNLDKQHPVPSLHQVHKKICCNDPSPYWNAPRLYPKPKHHGLDRRTYSRCFVEKLRHSTTTADKIALAKCIKEVANKAWKMRTRRNWFK